MLEAQNPASAGRIGVPSSLGAPMSPVKDEVFALVNWLTSSLLVKQSGVHMQVVISWTSSDSMVTIRRRGFRSRTAWGLEHDVNRIAAGLDERHKNPTHMARHINFTSGRNPSTHIQVRVSKKVHIQPHQSF